MINRLIWPENIPIVDAHHHFWNIEKNIYPWLQESPPPELVCGDITPIRKNYLVDDFKNDIWVLPVKKSVHIQCDWDPSDTVGETKWLQTKSESTGFPTAMVAFAELQNDKVEHTLEGHSQFSNTRGIRQILNWHEDPVLTFGAPKSVMKTAAWRKGFSLLKKYNLSFDLQIYPHQMNEAVKIATMFPDIQIILNHCGMPVDRTADGIKYWRKEIKLLARHENIAVKISGLGMTDHQWTLGSIRPFILDVIDIFGTERCMFASNFPVDRLYGRYSDLWLSFLEIVKDFSLGEKQALFHDNANSIYRLSEVN